ncbi:MAG: DUF4382 domain-containing protein [Cyanobacteria bacterium P01_A01_bin.123]
MQFHAGLFAAIALGSFSLVACTNAPPSTAPSADTPEAEATDATPAESSDVGNLAVRANGEDFVRQGFVSKDGWQISFDHVYVNLTEVTAYQSDPPFDPDGDVSPEATVETLLIDEKTVDLAAGGDAAEPILVSEVAAPPGRYNALAWKMVPASDGPAAGQTLQLIGTAEKEGRTVNFILNVDQSYTYVCGDYVGAARKGILEAGGDADLEATFHFDHLFGDGEAPPDDAINVGALGFEPLATLAADNSLEVDMATLETQFSDEDYTLLETALIGLGHVGEGHCAETTAS